MSITHLASDGHCRLGAAERNPTCRPHALPPVRVGFRLRLHPTYITGIWNSAPALIPVGQRDVIAFSFV